MAAGGSESGAGYDTRDISLRRRVASFDSPFEVGKIGVPMCERADERLRCAVDEVPHRRDDDVCLDLSSRRPSAVGEVPNNSDF